MELKTIVNLPDYGFKIDHTNKCMFIGSCFSENIGEKLIQTKINTSVNPTGIHYNPYSIAQTLYKIKRCSFIGESDIFFSNGIWNNFNFHSKFSATSKDETIKNINTAVKSAHKKFTELDYLFITFGTSYVYLLNDTQEIVSNCHKLPSSNFERKFLSPREIVMKWLELIKELNSVNPDLKIIFTVSPIRHWKDGAMNNAFSKSSLLLSIKELIEYKLFNNLYYFPAFEIVNDELRDYRFYADDMLHPSQLAIEYIWEKFSKAFFTIETADIIKKIKKINQAANHRPFNKQTEEYRKFSKKILNDIISIEKDFPYIDMQSEKKQFSLN